MISICSEISVSCLYTPKGYADLKSNRLTPKDKRIYGIPEKLAYLDIIAGIALIIIGALASHNIIGVNGASYFIGFGSAQLAIGLIFKLLSCFCPCLGPDRCADNNKLYVLQEDGRWIDDDGNERPHSKKRTEDSFFQ